jgi:hypothetical protein
MLAALVSLVAVLGMAQVKEKQRQPVAWPTQPFEVGVPVRSVVFSPSDGVVTITVDEPAWYDLAQADQQAMGHRYKELAQPFGATTVQIAGSSGTPLVLETPTKFIQLPAPPVP